METSLELLQIRPLNVLENGNILITSKHFDVLLDYSKYGINESGIMFNVVKQPNFGTISIDKWRRDYYFTLFDISMDKV